MYTADGDGRIFQLSVPHEYDGKIVVPLPFGLSPGSRSAVRKTLGAPAASPKVDYIAVEQPNDIFDLPDHTVYVTYDAKAANISMMYLFLAEDCVEDRAQRASGVAVAAPASAPAPVAPAKKKAAPGAHLAALIAAIRKGKKPKAGVAALLESKMPADLRELLEAHAHHDHGRINVGDFKLFDDVTDDNVPSPDDGPYRRDRIAIGRTAGGDLWVVEKFPKTKRTPVNLAVHDDDWREQKGAKSIDELLASEAAEADPDRLDIHLP